MMSLSDPPRPRFGADPGPTYLAVGLLFGLELFRRAFLGHVPDDFTAYLHAADLFVSGADPFTDARFSAPRYAGKPFNYLPGTLWFFSPLAWLPTSVAVSLEWILRGAALVTALRWLWRRIVPSWPFHAVLLVALLHQPLMVDLLFGNVVTYLLFAVAACIRLAERPRLRASDMGLLVACGALLALKPFWFLPAGYALMVRRRWPAVAALGAGGLIIALLSLPLWEMIPHLIAHTRAMRAFYDSVDLLSLAPALLPVAALAWGLGAWRLGRGRHAPWAFVFGCLSIPVWPRLATYSYALTLPVIFFLCRRWGWRRGLLWSLPLIGPLPWLLRVAPWLPEGQLESWVHFTWTIVTAAVVFAILERPVPAAEPPS